MRKSTLLTPQQIQVDYHLPRCRVYSILHSNEFPVIRIGKRLYVDALKFEEWLRTKETASKNSVAERLGEQQA